MTQIGELTDQVVRAEDLFRRLLKLHNDRGFTAPILVRDSLLAVGYERSKANLCQSRVTHTMTALAHRIDEVRQLLNILKGQLRAAEDTLNEANARDFGQTLNV